MAAQAGHSRGPADTPDELFRATCRVALNIFEAPPDLIHRMPDFSNHDTNPFTWLQDYYRFKPPSPMFGTQMEVLYGLVGLTLVLSTITLILQFYTKCPSRPHWFCKRYYHTQSRTPFIVPHPVNLIVLASFITSFLLLLYGGLLHQAYALGRLPRFIRIASWFPAVWMTFYTAVWLSGIGSFYLTYLIPLQYTRRGSLNGVKKHISPLLLNCVGFIVPILCCATVLPLQVRQATQMRTTMKGTIAFNRTLTNLSSAWENGTSLTMLPLEAALDAGCQVYEDKRTWEAYWNAEMALWAFFTLLALGVSVPLCLSMVISTHQRIRRMVSSQSTVHGWRCNALASAAGNGQFESSKCPSVASDEKEFEGFSLSYAQGTPRTPTTPGSGYTSPAPSFPSSAIPSASTREYANQPFFLANYSPSQTDLQAPDSPSTHTQSPIPAPWKSEKPSRSGRRSLNSFRRMSHYAIFPSKIDAMGNGHRPDLKSLDKKYWHIAGENLAILLIVALLSAFALFDLVSRARFLTDCAYKVLSSLVVSFTYTCLINLWLMYNLYRMVAENNKTEKSSPPSSVSDRRSRKSGVLTFGDYSLGDERRSSRSSPSVQFALPSVRQHLSGSLEDIKDEHEPNAGLRIELGETRLGVKRPSASDSHRENSFERRRSSYRAPSLDIIDALAAGPPETPCGQKGGR